MAQFVFLKLKKIRTW